MHSLDAEIQRRDFRLLAAGQALSWLGTGFQTVALAVAVLQAGGGPGQLGLVLACSVAAMLLCTLFGGVWADRVQPQRAMVLSDLVRCASVSAMELMFGTGHYSLPLLATLAAITAGAGAFFTPAMTALKPTLVTIEGRRAANATLGLLQTSCSVGAAADAAVGTRLRLARRVECGPGRRRTGLRRVVVLLCRLGTAIQDHVPHRVLARVSSWDMLTSFVGMPLGNVLAGPLAGAFGIDRVFVGCALVLAGAGAAPLFVAGSRTLTRPPAAPPAEIAAELDSSAAVGDASGLP